MCGVYGEGRGAEDERGELHLCVLRVYCTVTSLLRLHMRYQEVPVLWSLQPRLLAVDLCFSVRSWCFIMQ